MTQQADQYDYTIELVSKWTTNGYLQGVKEQHRTKVAQRLEAAHRRSLGQRGDLRSFEAEVSSLVREGFFKGSPR